MGSKGPYILLGRLLIPGLNLIIQSQAVKWATVGLLLGPDGAGRRSERPAGGPKQADSLGYIGGSILSSGCRNCGRPWCIITFKASVCVVNWLDLELYEPPALCHSTHRVCKASCGVLPHFRLGLAKWKRPLSSR